LIPKEQGIGGAKSLPARKAKRDSFNDAISLAAWGGEQKVRTLRICLCSSSPPVELKLAKLYISSVLRRTLIIATCFLLVGLIGWLDYITGFENSLLIFYLAPIAIGTWFLGIGFGIAIAILCVIATILADLAGGVPRVPVWNCGTAFVAYLIFSFLLRRYHSLLSEMHVRVKERTADLQRELARRQQLEKEIAVVAEEERTRVGRELHDSLGQHLAGTGLLAETVANQLDKENNIIQPTARKVVRLIDQGIELTREIARGLYSSELDGDGLFSALESLSRSVGKGQVKCEFEHSGKPPRSKELATQVYWVAREAVANALKHGQPQHVWIHLRTTDDYLRLKVEDDGRGLSQSTREDGIGLKVMAQRAEIAGGRLRIEKAVQGTVVHCEIPLSEN
jgi:signal transduction histidine kinase